MYKQAAKSLQRRSTRARGQDHTIGSYSILETPMMVRRAMEQLLTSKELFVLLFAFCERFSFNQLQALTGIPETVYNEVLDGACRKVHDNLKALLGKRRGRVLLRHWVVVFDRDGFDQDDDEREEEEPRKVTKPPAQKKMPKRTRPSPKLQPARSAVTQYVPQKNLLPPRGVQFGTLRCHALLKGSDGKEALETLTMKEAIERMEKLASWGGLEATRPYLDAIRNEFFGLAIFVGGRA